jgi:uncharacterized protein (TIGR03790 family)
LAALSAWFAVPALPASALDARHVAVVVNIQDPLSVAVGKYYAAKRQISFQNIIKVDFAPDSLALTSREFSSIRESVEGQATPSIQAYALTWTSPYRVDCMSITSAFTFGFDPTYCAEKCRPTKPNPYFNSRVQFPFRQLHMRLAMTIAAASVESAKALIDRGVQSDGTRPAGTAYLVSTTDTARNVRNRSYPVVLEMLGRRARVVEGEALRDAKDVLFYFIGKDRVEALETLRFVPGAIGDHLTSFGGQLTDSSQMSALRWLEAGATGSYGTVVEPCNLPEKFPNPAVAIASYLLGDTLIEAYWKSVAMPGQGIFIGEPLAAPFRRRATR